jgi:hypothetical protein
MITLSAATKAGAVCPSLLSPEVQFCKIPKMHLEAVIRLGSSRSQQTIQAFTTRPLFPATKS